MKIMRRRRPSMKTALGITKAKRSFARATGTPPPNKVENVKQ